MLRVFKFLHEEFTRLSGGPTIGAQVTVLLRVDLLHAAAEAALGAQRTGVQAAGGKPGRSPARRKATPAGQQQLKLNVRSSGATLPALPTCMLM
jgi:hypothetical protein